MTGNTSKGAGTTMRADSGISAETSMGTDPVSRCLAARGLHRHHERTTAHKKVIWRVPGGGLWVAITRRKGDYKVEFADRLRALKHARLGEVGNQFVKNGSRNISYRPESDSETTDLLRLAEQWLTTYVGTGP